MPEKYLPGLWRKSIGFFLLVGTLFLWQRSVVLPAQPASPRSPWLPGVQAPLFLSYPTSPTPFSPNPSASPTALTSNTPATPAPLLYYTQAGDTLLAIAARFRLLPENILLPKQVSSTELLDPGMALIIPGYSTDSIAARRLLPDSEVVFSPSAVGFDIAGYIAQAGGYLSTYREYLRSTGWTSGAEIVGRVALENSVNPRLLLSLLEYQCGCVLGPLAEGVAEDHLLGVNTRVRQGLYRQLGWAVNQLSLGYYGWRNGLVTELYFVDGEAFHLAPDLNAGSVALSYFFAQLYDYQDWRHVLDPEQGFPALHQRMFGDPWRRARSVEPLYPPGLAQPELILPFTPGKVWSYTSGPHKAWETDGALAALDFAPASEKDGCVRSDAWAVAVADGRVARAEHGAVILDLDGDGCEQTGWAILYMHVESRDRVAAGTDLRAGDPIGHPSCEGGPASGSHLHIARKYNGEWIPADGALPFVLDGWVVHAGYKPYEGTLTKGDLTIVANPYTPSQAFISRPAEDTPAGRKFNRSLLWYE